MTPGVYVVEHKCLAGSASIFDHNTGTYETAASLCSRGVEPKVSAMAPDGRIVVAQAKRVVPATVRAVYRVTTLGGRTLRVSGNHPIWTPGGWVSADSLRDGAWVATPKAMPSPVVDAPVSDEGVRLLGYMIGDGSFSNMAFTKSDEDVLEDVVRCAATVGEDVAISRPRERAPYIKFSKVGPVAETLMSVGFGTRDLAADKRLPHRLALSDRQLGQIVGALWSTDGCVDTATTTSGSAKLRIIYTSRSHDLCLDIQHALQRLGVVSNVRTSSVEYRGERRPVSTVQVVSRASKRRFLALAIEGVIPLLRSRVAIAEAVASIPTSPQGDDNRMQPTLHAHLWWDRVEAIHIENPEQTYDLEVPGPHTFVVDGVITHNTTSLEIGMGSSYWRRLTLDSQVSNYLVGARALGHEPKGVLYDVTRKVQLRPYLATPTEQREYTKPKDRACKECKKKNPTPAPHVELVGEGDDAREVACVDGRIVTDPGGKLYANMRDRDETPDEYRARVRADIAAAPEKYFQRGTIVRLLEEEREAALDVWTIGEQIRASQRRNRWRRNLDTCDSYGAWCSYWPVCAGEASIDDPTRYRDAKEHEELEVVTVAATTKRRLPILSTSSARAYGSCPRKYYYAYELRRRAVADTDALRFGTLFHKGLEVWWKTVDLAAAVAAMREAYKQLAIEPIDAIRAEELMLGYHVRWHNESLTVLDVEREFSAPLVDPETSATSRTWQRGGKIDAVVRVEAVDSSATQSAA